jgi:hypothetical protein
MSKRKYFTLAIKEDGVWAPQFGDYDRECVEQERVDTYAEHKKANWRILATSGHQRDINAAVAALNGAA